MCKHISFQWTCKACHIPIAAQQGPEDVPCSDVKAGRKCRVGTNRSVEHVQRPLGYADSHQNCPESPENKAKRKAEQEEKDRKRKAREEKEAAEKKAREDRERAERKAKKDREQKERSQSPGKKASAPGSSRTKK